MDFESLRAAHPRFIYHGFSCAEEGRDFLIRYRFEVPGLAEWSPVWRIPLGAGLLRSPTDAGAKNFIFNLGMVEALSYWKATCSPLIEIRPALLDEEALAFWETLFWQGLGEFRHRNGIALLRAEFVRFFCAEGAPDLRAAALAQAAEARAPRPFAGVLPETARPRALVPVGGGKDSVVSLERLRGLGEGRFAFAINANEAILRCMDLAEVPEERRILPRRSLDPGLLELNARGYLNGHTPFSALVAFSASFCAYLYGLDDVVLSNESSANESSVKGSEVNHQYSKSSAFERDFALYLKTCLAPELRYFSLLRPFSELAIARDFARYPAYHGVFRSCNVGSKRGCWCGRCAKCLFVGLMLLPFIGLERTERIVGEGIFAAPALAPTFDELCGFGDVKPFECVGTVDEVHRALMLYLNQVLRGGSAQAQDFGALPRLLRRYAERARANDAALPLRWCEAEGRFVEREEGRLSAALCARFAGHLVPPAYAPFIEDFLDYDAEGLPRPPAHLRRLLDYLRGKAILILGFGREGRSSLRLLERYLPEEQLGRLALADREEITGPYASLYRCHCGADYLYALGAYELVLKAPGISLKEYARLPGAPLRLAAWPGAEISGQIDLCLRFCRALRLFGISGTKGKSTCTALLYAMLSADERPCHIRGNIGLPVFDGLQGMRAGERLCLELSSHQLEFVQASPHLAALSNFYPEHLDHYTDLEAYYRAKLNILRYQGAADFCALNGADDALTRAAAPLFERPEVPHLARIAPSPGSGPEGRADAEEAAGWGALPEPELELRVDGEAGAFTLFDRRRGLQRRVAARALNPRLRGPHHIFDAALAAALAYADGLAPERIEAGLARFVGLPHRCEWVRRLRGVDYYNDSIATIPQATRLALETLPEVSCLILGGMDRGIDYGDFLDYLLARDDLRLICLPDTGHAQAASLSARGAGERCVCVATVEEAVARAAAEAPPGTAVLLSPAASSYHRYKNFEERGEDFRRAVFALAEDLH